ncbi:7-cyano-7-deazaguanine synthase [Leptolyngbya boryana CZ1]|uniref:7-cyano-7-deazaguanine synthase n=1 Tax=Leptolyngbya boryana CZ1 TaxID=3060204 RepID=A0AA96WSB9_LEPBY|nr:7-cyano-7-deazaguanine synthase [Leptolyngbya boryana]WNZ44463.1 7-cyano-7-deazaguanine synthase [Leptolyngbya boryana CZ1]
MEKHNVQDKDYTLIFSPVMDRNGNVCFVDHSRNRKSTIGIVVDDSNFGYRIQQEFPSIIADLIDLAVAIHASDRLSLQNLRHQQARISIVLPVRHPELLSADPFQEKLSDLLEWATGSRWVFDFRKRLASERSVEQQPLLSPINSYVDEIALWSGGLDALAGLYTRLKANPEKSFMLFGAGSNDNAFDRQKRVFQVLRQSSPNNLHLCQIPIRFSASNQHQKNKISRARGIVFTLLGSACAYLMGQRVLHLYENGIGAINLPYRKSAVGLDHSRSVHPLTLLKVSELISGLLGEEFQVKNPFLFWTKARMCRTLAEDGRNDLQLLTMSCDRPHRQQPTQCGYCSSCILRKQAIAASLMEDKTRYIVPHGNKLSGDTNLYLQHMLLQVSTLRDLLKVSDVFSVQWESLTRRFPELDDIVDRAAMAEDVLPADMQKHLIRLYQTYVAEWAAVEPRISADFLNQVSDQQSSDGCLTVI